MIGGKDGIEVDGFFLPGGQAIAPWGNSGHLGELVRLRLMALRSRV